MNKKAEIIDEYTIRDVDGNKIEFWKEPDESITAVWPEVLNPDGVRTMVQSYSHIGQHSEADYSFFEENCIRLKLSEVKSYYSGILKELESIGYLNNGDLLDIIEEKNSKKANDEDLEGITSDSTANLALNYLQKSIYILRKGNINGVFDKAISSIGNPIAILNQYNTTQAADYTKVPNDTDTDLADDDIYQETVTQDGVTYDIYRKSDGTLKKRKVEAFKYINGKGTVEAFKVVEKTAEYIVIDNGKEKHKLYDYKNIEDKLNDYNIGHSFK